MSEMAVIIYSHPTAVHFHLAGCQGLKRLFGSGEGVVDGETHGAVKLGEIEFSGNGVTPPTLLIKGRFYPIPLQGDGFSGSLPFTRGGLGWGKDL